MNWLDWLQVFLLYVALGFAYAEIRRLRGRVEKAEAALQQIATSTKEDTHD